MNKLKNKILIIVAMAFCILTQVSCNKDLETPQQTLENGLTIGQLLNSNPSYSLFLAAATKADLLPLLNDTANKVTLFLPTDAAMTASGLTQAGIAATPAATLSSVLKYHMISGNVTSSLFANNYPNVRFPTNLGLDPNNGFVRMSIFPALQTATTPATVNNVPITIPNTLVNNGVVHVVAGVLFPPSATLKTVIAGESTLSYFRAAVARADSGSVGLSRFDSLMNYGVLNMTVLAPNDNAFKTLVFGLVYSNVLSAGGSMAVAAATANGAVAAGPAFLNTNNVSTAQIRGIIAYHILASNSTGAYQPNVRVFGINVQSTPAFVKTLVNGAVSIHPGIRTIGYYSSSLLPDSVKFAGLGTFPPGGAPFSTPVKVLSADKQGVNGVFHIIDAVLLPQ